MTDTVLQSDESRHSAGKGSSLVLSLAVLADIGIFTWLFTRDPQTSLLQALIAAIIVVGLLVSSARQGLTAGGRGKAYMATMEAFLAGTVFMAALPSAWTGTGLRILCALYIVALLIHWHPLGADRHR